MFGYRGVLEGSCVLLLVSVNDLMFVFDGTRCMQRLWLILERLC